VSSLNIKVKVDQAGALSSLNSLHKAINRVGKSTTDVKKKFKDFNQTMFGATAFIGMFTQAFTNLSDVMMAGSQLDRSMTQFGKRFSSELPASMKTFTDNSKAELGTSGRFIQMIRGMTTNSIDMMSAMNSAIQLKSSGVVGTVKDMAELMAMAGTAAKSAGKDSAEGIRRVTSFLKDGSLAHLQHLGLLRESSPELIAYKAVLGKASGVMGTAMTSAFKLSFGMRVLRDATKGQLKGQRDLRDTLQDLAQFFGHLKSAMGNLLTASLQPLLEAFTEFQIKATVIIQDIIKNKKEILFLAKAFVIGATALAGFVLVIGTFRLAVTALTSLVGGIPLLTIVITALAAAVIFSKTSLKGLVEGFHTFGAVAQGAFQLIQSFTNDADNFAAGIGKMDAKTHDMLKKKGLLGLVENISRVGAVIKIFVTSAAGSFMDTLDSMLSSLGSVGDKIKNFLGMDSKKWGRNWLDTAESMGKAFGKVAISILGIVAAFKLLSMGKSIFGAAKGLFSSGKSGGKAPKGTSRDPLWVRMKSSLPGLSGTATAGSGSFWGSFPGRGSKAASSRLESPYDKGPGKLRQLLTTMGGGAMKFLGHIGKAFSKISKVLSPFRIALVVIATLVTGFSIGLFKGKEKIGNFVKGIVDWGNTFTGIGKRFGQELDTLKSLFVSIYAALKAVFGSLLRNAEKAGEITANALGSYATDMHLGKKNANVEAGVNWQQKYGKTSMQVAAYDSDRKKGKLNIPAQNQNAGQSLGLIFEAINRSTAAQSIRMNRAVKDALSTTEGDKTANITREEWVAIFTAGMDKSQKLGNIDENSKKTNDNTSPTGVKSARTGMC